MHLERLAKLIDRPLEAASLPVTAAYPRSQLKREVAKAAAGIAVCLGVVAVLAPSVWLAVPLVGVALVFGLYLRQQAMRFGLRMRIEESGLTLTRGGHSRTHPWANLSDFRLNFYPHGRKAKVGSLTVVLHIGGERIKADSTLDHFPALLERAARAARERGLELHPTTAVNLEQLDL